MSTFTNKLSRLLQGSLLTVALAFLTLGHIPSFSIPGTATQVQGLGQTAYASDIGFWECVKNPTSTSIWRGGVCRLASVALGALAAVKTLQAMVTKMVLKKTKKGKPFEAQEITITIPNEIGGVKIWNQPITITFNFTETHAKILAAIVGFSVMDFAFKLCMCFDKIGYIDYSDPNERYA